MIAVTGCFRMQCYKSMAQPWCAHQVLEVAIWCAAGCRVAILLTVL